MTSEWRTIRAADFIDFNPRLSLKKGDIATKVAMDKLKPFTKKIPETEKAEFNGGAKFCNGDTVMARITPCLENGKTAYVDMLDDGEIGFGSTEFIVMRAKKGISDPQFVYYTAINPVFRYVAIKSMVGSSGRQRVQQSVLEELELSVPDLDEQRRIGDFLARIDEKIALNDRINDNLQHQLKLMHDYWFTQFDFPDENGKPYQTSGGKMSVNNILKMNIPESWCVQSVYSNRLSSIIKPGVAQFDTKTYLATADVKGTSISAGTLIDYENRENRANMQPSVNSVWFAKMKNSIKHLYLNKEMLPIISSSVLSTGFCGLQCNEVSFEYIASYISNSYFEIHKDMLAHGATQEAVNNDDLISIHLVIPDDRVLHAYHNTAQPLYAQISKNICENKELVKLRDWLLPMLMNGQATISD